MGHIENDFDDSNRGEIHEGDDKKGEVEGNPDFKVVRFGDETPTGELGAVREELGVGISHEEETIKEDFERTKDRDFTNAGEGDGSGSHSEGKEILEMSGGNRSAYTMKKGSVWNRFKKWVGIAGAVGVGLGAMSQGARAETETSSGTGEGEPLKTETTAVSSEHKIMSKKPESNKDFVTEGGVWAPLLLRQIEGSVEDIEDTNEAQLFVTKAHGAFIKEINSAKGVPVAELKTAKGEEMILVERGKTSADWKLIKDSSDKLKTLIGEVSAKWSLPDEETASKIDQLDAISGFSANQIRTLKRADKFSFGLEDKTSEKSSTGSVSGESPWAKEEARKKAETIREAPASTVQATPAFERKTNETQRRIGMSQHQGDNGQRVSNPPMRERRTQQVQNNQVRRSSGGGPRVGTVTIGGVRNNSPRR